MHIIKIRDLIAPILSSREVVSFLENTIRKYHDSQIQLDFSDVKFISRSAAHELLQLQQHYLKKWIFKKNISFTNVSVNIQEMFNISRAVPNKERRWVKSDYSTSALEEILNG